MAFLSIEIKARLLDLERIRGVLGEQNADFKGTDHQKDTYFRVPSGRMKLREGNIENSLVYYDREDKRGPKQSKTLLYRTLSSQELRELLATALGVLAVVEKRREIYFIENVKFHLDAVAGLGFFVEIEALDENHTIGKPRLQRQCRYYLDMFEIPEEHLIPDSYSDLILKKNG